METGRLHARAASPPDAASIAAIYNQGIEDRIATFETEPRTAAHIAPWFDGRHPVVAVEEEGRVVAFAAVHPYSARECYAGIGEASVYVAREARGRGAGRLALQRLIDEATRAGFWKLVARIFVENEASRRLVSRAGFREVGIYRKHARLDGVWRDCVVVEYLTASSAPAR
jgi:L-amino acid N-acyltransferase YncA